MEKPQMIRGLPWAARYAIAQMARVASEWQTCTKCGSKFASSRKRKLCQWCMRFKEDKTNFAMDRSDVYACNYCGDWYRSTDPKTKYCSKACGRGADATGGRCVDCNCVIDKRHQRCNSCSTLHKLKDDDFRAKMQQNVRKAHAARRFDETQIYLRYVDRRNPLTACTICGMPCRQKQCSDDCRKKQALAFYTPVPKALRVCNVCGKVVAMRESEKYCSKRCSARQTKYRRKQRKRTNGPCDDIIPRLVFQRDNWKCCYCGCKLKRCKKPHPRKATVDHVIPLARGGTHTWANVQSLCSLCNSKKGCKVQHLL